LADTITNRGGEPAREGLDLGRVQGAEGPQLRQGRFQRSSRP